MFKKNVSSSALLLEMMSLVLINDSLFKMSSRENKFGNFSVIKPEVNGLLDMARCSFFQYVRNMEDKVTELKQVSLWVKFVLAENYFLFALGLQLLHEVTLDQKQGLPNPSSHRQEEKGGHPVLASRVPEGLGDEERIQFCDERLHC